MKFGDIPPEGRWDGEWSLHDVCKHIVCKLCYLAKGTQTLQAHFLAAQIALMTSFFEYLFNSEEIISPPFVSFRGGISSDFPFVLFAADLFNSKSKI